jgi:hypothetical protein
VLVVVKIRDQDRARQPSPECMSRRHGLLTANSTALVPSAVCRVPAQQRAVCDIAQALNNGIPHVRPRFARPSIFYATSISAKSDVRSAHWPPLYTALSGSWGAGCTATSHLAQHTHQPVRPSNHLHCPPCAAEWIQRLQHAPVDQPQSTSARPQRINHLYNCGHLPLSSAAVLTHLLYRSATAIAKAA